MTLPISETTEVIDAAIRIVDLAPCEHFPDGYTHLYLACQRYTPVNENGGVYTTTLWSVTNGKVVEWSGKPQHSTTSWSEARCVWKMLLAPTGEEVA